MMENKSVIKYFLGQFLCVVAVFAVFIDFIAIGELQTINSTILTLLAVSVITFFVGKHLLDKYNICE